MSAIPSERFRAYFRQHSRFYEFDIHRIGQLNIELFGILTWACLSIGASKNSRYFQAFLGPVYLEFEYQPKTRAKRGTLAVLAMTALAVAGWTEGHLWRLPPFLA